MTDPIVCQLCGHTDKRDLGTSLAHWRDALPGMAYEHISACVDRVACRRRIEMQGDTWPLVETPADLRSA